MRGQDHSQGPHRRRRCGLARCRHAAAVAAHVCSAPNRAVQTLPLRKAVGGHDETEGTCGARRAVRTATPVVE